MTGYRPACSLVLAAVAVVFCVSSVSAQAEYFADTNWWHALKLEKESRHREALGFFKKSIADEKALAKPRARPLAAKLSYTGRCYYEMGQYENALRTYKEALAISEKHGLRDGIHDLNCGIGDVYHHWGKWPDALRHQKIALKVARELKDDLRIAQYLNNIAVINNAMGHPELAEKNYIQALAIAKRMKNDEDVALYLYNIAGIQKTRGQYDKAMNLYIEALEIHRKINRWVDVITDLESIGGIHNRWGQFNEAMEAYTEAFSLAVKMERTVDIPSILCRIGQVHEKWKQYDKAIEHYNEALRIERELGRDSGVATCLNNRGVVRTLTGQYDQALEDLSKALRISEEQGNQAGIAIRLSNLGQVHAALGNHEKAFNSYTNALTIMQKLGNVSGSGTCLHNAGTAQLELHRYEDAMLSLLKSVAIKEDLRKTASGSARMDYMASELDTYQSLILALSRAKMIPDAINIKELSSAKFLAEQLALETGSSVEHVPIDTFRKTLPKDTAVIQFANMEETLTFRFIADSKSVNGKEVPIKALLDRLPKPQANEVDTVARGLRGFRKVSSPETRGGEQGQNVDFEDVIAYYRSLLSQSGRNEMGNKILLDLGSQLYAFLIGPIEEHLAGKKNLIILPDGVLGYLPFESLITPDGKFLGEKYSIRYAHSMTVLGAIGKRAYKERKPMLVMGGAVYNAETYDKDMLKTDESLAALKKAKTDADARGGNMSEVYKRLGCKRWNNLPGTLAEAKEIAKLFSNKAVSFTGKEVTESRIKQLSESRELAGYEVIHLAAHGIVIPWIPELSAVVLSQGVEKEEDGYLRMTEVAQLDLQADFVNLSACQTGLGKLYGGEGVVGLTHAFLVAGANSLCVSLWQVADDSTMRFMVEMYKKAARNKKNYAWAMSETKREFIAGKYGDKFKDPYFWAPFVYYGY